MIRKSDGCTESPWSPRECELLAVTLQLLQEHGYDRLTVDAVATTARASKATLYRRWPTKAELVLAAFVEGTRQVAVEPDTGSAAQRPAAPGRVDLRSRERPCRHHPCGARRGLPERGAQRHNAVTVPRPAESPHGPRPRPRRRPRRDRPFRHHRRPVGRAARLPDLPVDLDRPGPVAAGPCATSSTMCSSPASPGATREHTCCGVRSRTVLSI